MKKRKIKLFASIASLAMVVAVMAVGVWAATTQSVTVATDVKFTIQPNVAAKVEMQIVKADNADVKSAAIDGGASSDANILKTEADTFGLLGEWAANASASELNKTLNIELEPADGVFDTGSTIKYEIKITNSTSATHQLDYEITMATSTDDWAATFENGSDTSGAGTIETAGGDDTVTVTLTYSGENSIGWANTQAFIPSITIALTANSATVTG